MHCHSTFIFPLLSSSLLFISFPRIFLLLDIYKASLCGKNILETPGSFPPFLSSWNFFNVIYMVFKFFFCTFHWITLIWAWFERFFLPVQVRSVKFISTMVKKKDILVQIFLPSHFYYLQQTHLSRINMNSKNVTAAPQIL